MQHESTLKSEALATYTGVLGKEKESKTLTRKHCSRCGYVWWPRNPKLPKRCAKCKTPYWNKPRKTGAQSGLVTLSGEEIIAGVERKLSPALAPGPDRSMQKALEVLKQMKASRASWAQMAERVLHDFGVQLDKDQLKALVR